MSDPHNTHFDGCWRHGSRHYQCALDEIERLREELAQERSAFREIIRQRSDDLAAAQRDAERWRFIRKEDADDVGRGWESHNTPPERDAVVDQLIALEKRDEA